MEKLTLLLLVSLMLGIPMYLLLESFHKVSEEEAKERMAEEEEAKERMAEEEEAKDNFLYLDPIVIKCIKDIYQEVNPEEDVEKVLEEMQNNLLYYKEVIGIPMIADCIRNKMSKFHTKVGPGRPLRLPGLLLTTMEKRLENMKEWEENQRARRRIAYSIRPEDYNPATMHPLLYGKLRKSRKSRKSRKKKNYT